MFGAMKVEAGSSAIRGNHSLLRQGRQMSAGESMTRHFANANRIIAIDAEPIKASNWRRKWLRRNHAQRQQCRRPGEGNPQGDRRGRPCARSRRSAPGRPPSEAFRHAAPPAAPRRSSISMPIGVIDRANAATDFLRDHKIEGTSMGGNQSLPGRHAAACCRCGNKGRLKLDHPISRPHPIPADHRFRQAEVGAPVRQVTDFRGPA